VSDERHIDLSGRDLAAIVPLAPKRKFRKDQTASGAVGRSRGSALGLYCQKGNDIRPQIRLVSFDGSASVWNNGFP
jgi:hypothetical protein